MKLDGKVALIIGGSAGLARAAAECCAAEGASIMIADVADGQDAVDAIVARGGKASFIRTDGTSDAENKAAIDATVEMFGGLDILINSIGGTNRLDSDDGWHRAIDLYLKSSYYACKYAVTEMGKRGGGAIINVASIAGVTGSISEAVEGTGYACAKHGVIGLTKTMALTYASKNIRVNVICPGYFKTDMTKMIHDNEGEGLSYITDTLRIPLGRWGRPEEIGTVAAFLAGPDASFITGQSIIVDGGFMAR